MKKAALMSFLVVAGALLFGCVPSGPSSGDDVSDAVNEAPKPAPEFELENVLGGTLKSEDLKGKVVVVDFWATWCAPCIEEIPNYNALYQKWSDQGMELIGITLESGSLEDVNPKVEEFGIEYPVVMGTDPVIEGFGGLIGFPTTFVVAKDWTIHERYLGMATNKKERLEEDIEMLLSQ